MKNDTKRTLVFYIVLISEIFILVFLSFFLLNQTPFPIKNSSLLDQNFNFNPTNVLHSININNDSKHSLENIILSSFRTYYDNCLFSDYVQPFSQRCLNQSGISLTLFDSLDTLILINSVKEVEKINEFLKKSFDCQSNSFMHTSDIITHVIGGLISAYTLTSNPLYIQKATECVNIALKAFKNDIPKPLVNGYQGSVKDYNWIDGTTLSESSGFLIEFQSFSCLIDNPSLKNKIKKAINSYLSCISNSLLKEDKLYSFWSTNSCSRTNDISGLSVFSVDFISNVLRYHIIYPSQYSELIINWFHQKFEMNFSKELFQPTDTFKPRFDSSFCQLLPLLSTYNSIYATNFSRNSFTKLHSFLKENCRNLIIDGITATSGRLEKLYLDIDNYRFNFESSFIEDYNLEYSKGSSSNDEFIIYKFLKKINAPDQIRCNESFCGLLSQDPKVNHDKLDPMSISKWSKYLLLEKGHLNYEHFIFNEAGHIIPKCSSAS